MKRDECDNKHSFEFVLSLFKKTAITTRVIVRGLASRGIRRKDRRRFVLWLRANGRSNAKGHWLRREELATALLEGLFGSAEESLVCEITLKLIAYSQRIYHEIINRLIHPRHARASWLEL
jgi:hypothetical protein